MWGCLISQGWRILQREGAYAEIYQVLEKIGNQLVVLNWFLLWNTIDKSINCCHKEFWLEPEWPIWAGSESGKEKLRQVVLLISAPVGTDGWNEKRLFSRLILNEAFEDTFLKKEEEWPYVCVQKNSQKTRREAWCGEGLDSQSVCFSLHSSLSLYSQENNYNQEDYLKWTAPLKGGKETTVNRSVRAHLCKLLHSHHSLLAIFTEHTWPIFIPTYRTFQTKSSVLRSSLICIHPKIFVV